jgi:hypothetical protein
MNVAEHSVIEIWPIRACDADHIVPRAVAAFFPRMADPMADQEFD